MKREPILLCVFLLINQLALVLAIDSLQYQMANHINKQHQTVISTEQPIQSLEEFIAQQELNGLAKSDPKSDELSSKSLPLIDGDGSSLQPEVRPPSVSNQPSNSSSSIIDIKNNKNKLLEVEEKETTTQIFNPINATASPFPPTSVVTQPTPQPPLPPTTTPKPILQHWQVKGLLNVTHDYPLAYSQIICGYIWPLMAAITLFTNLMITFVLTQRDMRTPTNVVLTAIAIADIIPIVVPVPWFVYLFAMGNENQVLYPPVACYFYQHSTRSVSEIFYFLSTWLNVLLAIQDYLTACWPKLAKKYCQIKVVVIEIISLTLLAFLLNLPQALKLIFKPVKFYYNGQLTWGCRALQARWFKDLVGEYVALYDDIFTGIIVIFVDGGPAILLITLTALLIRQLQRQRIQGHLLMEQARTASKRRRERHRQQEYEASARVMIFVLLAFLAVKIPFATTYTLMIIQSRFGIQFVEELVDFQKAITLTDLVFVLSYPINFTIFCCCSKKFRHKCAELLGECNYNTKTRTDRWMTSISGSYASGDSFNSQGADKRDSLATIASLSHPRYSMVSANNLNNININNNNNNSNNNTDSNQKKLSIEGQEVKSNANNRSVNNDSYNKRSSLSALLRQESIEATRKRLANCRSKTFDQDSTLDIMEGQQHNMPPEVFQFQFQPKRENLPVDCSTSARLTFDSEPRASADAAYCDGENHFDFRGRDADTSLPMDEEENFNALLEDGSLCVECIMRYEQLKRSKFSKLAVGNRKRSSQASCYSSVSGVGQQTAGSRSRLNSSSAGGGGGGGNPQPARRVSTTSADSVSWSISLPPMPPLGEGADCASVRSARLPHIVTTKWESIREQQSSAGSGSVDTQSNSTTRVNSRNFYTPTGEPSGTMSVAQQPKQQDHQDHHHHHHQPPPPPASQKQDLGFTSDGWMSPSSATSATSNTQSDCCVAAQTAAANLERHRGPSDQKQQHEQQPQPRRQHSSSNLKGNSDPGAGFLSLKQLSGFIRRSSDRSVVDENEEGAPPQSDPTKRVGDRLSATSVESGSGPRSRRRGEGVSNLAETRQRSLSLSNSNLTTLPNATGILADIFISTLLSAGGQVGGGPKGQFKNAKSKGKLKRDGR